jgi:hypothetical protein
MSRETTCNLSWDEASPTKEQLAQALAETIAVPTRTTEATKIEPAIRARRSRPMPSTVRKIHGELE